MFVLLISIFSSIKLSFHSIPKRRADSAVCQVIPCAWPFLYSTGEIMSSSFYCSHIKKISMLSSRDFRIFEIIIIKINGAKFHLHFAVVTLLRFIPHAKLLLSFPIFNKKEICANTFILWNFLLVSKSY